MIDPPAGRPVERREDEKVLSLHRCKVCGTAWLLWPDAIHGGGWNLLDKYQRPGSCCDNAPMGDQIEHLRDIPLAASPVPCAEPPADPWQPIETAPKDCTIIGALIRDGKVWRVHEMKHNGLAFYTTAGGSLPRMTHWIPMPRAAASPADGWFDVKQDGETVAWFKSREDAEAYTGTLIARELP